MAKSCQGVIIVASVARMGTGCQGKNYRIAPRSPVSDQLRWQQAGLRRKSPEADQWRVLYSWTRRIPAVASALTMIAIPNTVITAAEVSGSQRFISMPPP
jgi:hypothetical protein